MKMRLFFVLVIALTAASCRSAFEKVRLSGDVDRIYQAANKYFEEEEYQKAQTLFELIISTYRGRKEAEDIYFKYAYTYFYLERYILASYYFDNFSQTYSTSDLREESDFMSAYSNFMLSPSYRLDQTYTQKAIEGFQLFVNTYPLSDRVEECNRLIDAMRGKLERKAFEEGKLYYNLRHYQAAVQVFENMLKDFPETDEVEEIRYLIIKSAYDLADNSIVNKQPERFRDTYNRAAEYLERYPENKYRKEITKIFEDSKEKLNQLDNVGYQNQSARAGS